MSEARTPSAEPEPALTRDTRAAPTGRTDPLRDYPQVPGYEVLGVLGQGGMGVVYRARQRAANRLVALKMIRAVRDASPQERLRFQIETEAVARLTHPNVAQLYEAGEADGLPFFSLEFCDGGTLDKRLKAGRPRRWSRRWPAPCITPTCAASSTATSSRPTSSCRSCNARRSDMGIEDALERIVKYAGPSA